VSDNPRKNKTATLPKPLGAKGGRVEKGASFQGPETKKEFFEKNYGKNKTAKIDSR
jgi:hypothetical protein